MWKKHASTREFWAEVCWPLVARVQPPGSGLCWLHSALKSARSAITLCFTNILKAHCGNWANFLLLYQNTDMKICLIPNNAKAALGPSSRLFVRWDDDLKPVLSSFAMHSTGFPQEQCSHGVTDKCTGSTWGKDPTEISVSEKSGHVKGVHLYAAPVLERTPVSMRSKRLLHITCYFVELWFAPLHVTILLHPTWTDSLGCMNQ